MQQILKYLHNLMQQILKYLHNLIQQILKYLHNLMQQILKCRCLTECKFCYVLYLQVTSCNYLGSSSQATIFVIGPWFSSCTVNNQQHKRPTGSLYIKPGFCRRYFLSNQVWHELGSLPWETPSFHKNFKFDRSRDTGTVLHVPWHGNCTVVSQS